MSDKVQELNDRVENRRKVINDWTHSLIVVLRLLANEVAIADGVETTRSDSDNNESAPSSPWMSIFESVDSDLYSNIDEIKASCHRNVSVLQKNCERLLTDRADVVLMLENISKERKKLELRIIESEVDETALKIDFLTHAISTPSPFVMMPGLKKELEEALSSVKLLEDILDRTKDVQSDYDRIQKAQQSTIGVFPDVANENDE